MKMEMQETYKLILLVHVIINNHNEYFQVNANYFYSFYHKITKFHFFN